MRWDNKTFPSLNVLRVKFDMPLILPVKANSSVQSPSEDHLPPTRIQFNQISQSIHSLAAETKFGLRLLLWAVLLIGALVFFFK